MRVRILTELLEVKDAYGSVESEAPKGPKIKPVAGLERGLPVLTWCVIIGRMIKGFRDKETQRIAQGGLSRRFPRDIQRRAKMRLDRLNAATSPDDLRLPPSHRLEALSGDRAGQHSLRINDQWRLCFEWRDGHAWNVEISDYH